jgi:hypothetical protein
MPPGRKNSGTLIERSIDTVRGKAMIGAVLEPVLLHAKRRCSSRPANFLS